ncbi:platelet-activating factor acetylhydrolase-like [Mizuhopecten yessoensis]|uniref:1-alkyl-2-acetylglycerophosphocholine esterase n=1 Tax=Mizuhopecten yessoensis TaxID=6573 RepID=A0A210Q8U5_MIZYE|nr:platelet-activating factor acetylhydrolase-like [Mizuhopecten yessoensis]OWF45167.1 Platelet-activating factor acetylhydrolase [Mizuhopecten yessoensis]
MGKIDNFIQSVPLTLDLGEKIRKHLPPGTGEYSVGCLDCDHTSDPLSDTGALFRLYYPIEKTDIIKRHKQWPLWLPRRQYSEGFAHYLKLNTKVFGKIFKWLAGDVYIPALWQSPPVANGQKFPVVVFSHGIGGNRTTNTTMCTELASQGFIVAAMEHRDGSASMTYELKPNEKGNVEIVEEAEKPQQKRNLHKRSHSFHGYNATDAEWKPYVHYEPWNEFEYRNNQVKKRSRECSEALDILTSLNLGVEVHNTLGGNFNSKLFKDRMDLSKVIMIGHSFGGSTCLHTLAHDKRFLIGAVLDGWMHPLGKEVYTSITQPTLLLNMEKFQWKENIEQMLMIQNNQAEKVMITMRGACHQSVTDFQFIVGKRLARFMDCRHIIHPRVSMDLCNKAVLSFVWKHLGSEDREIHEDILSGDHSLMMKGTNVNMSC